MIERVLGFQQAICREVMVPRPLVATVDRSWTFLELRKFIAESVHSRFPVVDGSPDAIVGILHAKHLLRLGPGDTWTDLVVPPLYVPETRLVPNLLHDFRLSGQHMAIVLDEFGGLSGVITLEDALELLVGEIEDEFDQEQAATVRAEGDGWSVPGHLSIRRLQVILNRAIERPSEVDSVGGLVSHLLDEEVLPGAVALGGGIQLRVEEVEGGRASRVHVSRTPTKG